MLCWCASSSSHPVPQACQAQGLACQVLPFNTTLHPADVSPQVTDKGRRVELKSVAINKARPHQMAVAAGDAFLRLYDRRMLSRSAPGAGPAAAPVLKLAPPHLALGAGVLGTPQQAVSRLQVSAQGFSTLAPMLLLSGHLHGIYELKIFAPLRDPERTGRSCIS